MGNQSLTPISPGFDSEIDHAFLTNLNSRVTVTGMGFDDTAHVFKESESLISFEKLSENVPQDVWNSLETYVDKNRLYFSKDKVAILFQKFKELHDINLQTLHDDLNSLRCPNQIEKLLYDSLRFDYDGIDSEFMVKYCVFSVSDPIWVKQAFGNLKSSICFRHTEPEKERNPMYISGVLLHPCYQAAGRFPNFRRLLLCWLPDGLVHGTLMFPYSPLFVCDFGSFKLSNFSSSTTPTTENSSISGNSEDVHHQQQIASIYSDSLNIKLAELKSFLSLCSSKIIEYNEKMIYQKKFWNSKKGSVGRSSHDFALDFIDVCLGASKSSRNKFFVGQCREFLEKSILGDYHSREFICNLRTTWASYFPSTSLQPVAFNFATHEELDSFLRESIVLSYNLNVILGNSNKAKELTDNDRQNLTKEFKELGADQVSAAIKFMEKNYPGDWQLLQGFDRSYFLVQEKVSEVKSAMDRVQKYLDIRKEEKQGLTGRLKNPDMKEALKEGILSKIADLDGEIKQIMENSVVKTSKEIQYLLESSHIRVVKERCPLDPFLNVITNGPYQDIGMYGKIMCNNNTNKNARKF